MAGTAHRRAERRDRPLALMLAGLKSTPRSGWMLRGVPAAIAESIAEHLAESAILALVLGERVREKGVAVDIYLAAAIAAAHDAAEAFVGDIVKRAVDIIGRDAKERAELLSLKEEGLGGTVLYRLVAMYVKQDTLEAKVAKAAETLSTLIQAVRYYEAGHRWVSEIACSSYRTLRKLGESCRAAREALEMFEHEAEVAASLCGGEGSG